MKERLLKIVEAVIEYSLYALLFFIPISKAGIEIFAGIAFISFIVKKILNPDFRFLKSWPHLFLLLFVFFASLSFINSGPLIAKSFKALFIKWLKYLGIFLFMQDTFSQPRRLQRALVVILIVATIVSIDGLSEKLFQIEFLGRGFKKIEPARGITASFNHYNDFSSYLIVLLSLVIGLLAKREKPYKWGLFALGISLSACLMFTFSRGAWLGLLFSLVLMIVLSPKSKILYYVLLAHLSLIVLIPSFKERVLFTFSPLGDADRFIVWRAAVRMIKEHPFLGVGLGTFMDNFLRYSPKRLFIQYAHNCYLQIWAETGLFGLLSFLGLVTSLLLKALVAFKKKNSFLILGLSCGIFGFLVHSFFDTQFYSLQLSAFFWSMAGLLYTSSGQGIVA